MFYFNCMGISCAFPCARYPLTAVQPIPLLFMVEEVMRALELYDFVARLVVADAASENRKVQRLMCTRPASDFLSETFLVSSGAIHYPKFSPSRFPSSASRWAPPPLLSYPPPPSLTPTPRRGRNPLALMWTSRSPMTTRRLVRPMPSSTSAICRTLSSVW